MLSDTHTHVNTARAAETQSHSRTHRAQVEEPRQKIARAAETEWIVVVAVLMNFAVRCGVVGRAHAYAHVASHSE